MSDGRPAPPRVVEEPAPEVLDASDLEVCIQAILSAQWKGEAVERVAATLAKLRARVA